ncbi:MAG TPA: hypothetical protein VKA50_06370 [Gammaproteobacteria bacterium]|nr:hypothetical protein [Gammaproteobacteria bacterium]
MKASSQTLLIVAAALLLAAGGIAPPAQAAMSRGQPIHWGGGAARSSQSGVSHYRQWRPLWRYVWSRTEKVYDMRPAPTVAGTRNCPANLDIGRIVEQTIDAVSRRRSGDVVNRLGQFQSRLLCLSVDGAHGVDFALSAFDLFAVRDLRGREREEAVAGTFNLGLLAFDAIQYSGRSWWLPVMSYERGTVSSVLRHYPGRQLGLWLYDVERGSLQQLKFGGNDWHVYTGLMHAFAHPGVFDRGECSLLGMAAEGFSCGRGGADNRSMGSGTGSGGGGGGLGMGGGSGGATSCMIEATMQTGSLGTLSCMARAGGLGGSHMPTTAAGHVQMRGVIDSQCAVSDGPGKAPKLPDYNAKKSGSAHPNANKVGRGIVSAFLHWLSGGGGGGGSSKPAKGSGGHGSHTLHTWTSADTARLQANKAAHKAKLEAMKKRAAERHHLKKFHGGGSGRSFGGSGGSACGGHGTNAAMQVAASFACTGGGSARGGRSASGPRFPGAGGGGPFAMPGSPGGGAGAPSGLLQCSMQGGQLVRASRNDKRCAQSYCAQGGQCSCNGSGGSAPSSVTASGRRKVTSPNNANNGAMDYGRNHVGNFGGFTGPKLPGVGGGPSKQ